MAFFLSLSLTALSFGCKRQRSDKDRPSRDDGANGPCIWDPAPASRASSAGKGTSGVEGVDVIRTSEGCGGGDALGTQAQGPHLQKGRASD